MCTFCSMSLKLKQRFLSELFLFKFWAHSDHKYGNSKVLYSRRSLKNQSFEYDFYVHIPHDSKSKILKVSCSCFLDMLGFKRRASQTPLYTSLHSIVSTSPHFLLPQCTSFTAEHRDGASQGGRRRRGGERGR